MWEEERVKRGKVRETTKETGDGCKKRKEGRAKIGMREEGGREEGRDASRGQSQERRARAKRKTSRT